MYFWNGPLDLSFHIATWQGSRCGICDGCGEEYLGEFTVAARSVLCPYPGTFLPQWTIKFWFHWVMIFTRATVVMVIRLSEQYFDGWWWSRDIEWGFFSKTLHLDKQAFVFFLIIVEGLIKHLKKKMFFHEISWVIKIHHSAIKTHQCRLISLKMCYSCSKIIIFHPLAIKCNGDYFVKLFKRCSEVIFIFSILIANNITNLCTPFFYLIKKMQIKDNCFIWMIMGDF